VKEQQIISVEIDIIAERGVRDVVALLRTAGK
jgi:hypothetical protein